MVADAERLAKEDAAHVERVEARNEFEAALFAAKDYAASATAGGVTLKKAVAAKVAELAELVRVQEAWLDLAPATTPAAAFRAKQAELEAKLGMA